MQIKVEIKGYEHAQDLMDAYPERVKRSNVWAINRAARGVTTDAAKVINKIYNVKQSIIKPNISRKLATRQRPVAYVSFFGRNIGLEYFSPKPNVVDPAAKKHPIGVRVTIQRGFPRYIKGSFLAGSKHRGTFGIYKRYGDSRRLPIKVVTGPSIANMAKGAGINDDSFTLSVQERFMKNFEHQITQGFKYIKSKKW